MWEDMRRLYASTALFNKDLSICKHVLVPAGGGGGGSCGSWVAKDTRESYTILEKVKIWRQEKDWRLLGA
jgi:hypothetical protein